jgi:hypothetical protein
MTLQRADEPPDSSFFDGFETLPKSVLTRMATAHGLSVHARASKEDLRHRERYI